MIQQQVGDLLEIEFQGKFYYVVVLTPIVHFGGNVLFAIHTDGAKTTPDALDALLAQRQGFNICGDLLLAKRLGIVTRLRRLADVTEFWRTKYTKWCAETRPGVKAKCWFIGDIHRPGVPSFEKLTELTTPEYRGAMDKGCFSFDLVGEKILRGYTPDQNSNL